MHQDFPKPQAAGPSPAGDTDGKPLSNHLAKSALEVRKHRGRRTRVIWERADVRGPDECWPWRGAKTRDGYGRHFVNGRDTLAHRAALVASGVELKAGQAVLHSCDNRACVNPAHLSAGTWADNSADCKAKRRHTHGERSASAKLRERDVQEIVTRFRAGATRYQLAAAFGVTHRTICYIVRGERWTHVA